TSPAPASATLAAMELAAQSFHLAALALAVFGCWRSARTRVAPGVGLMLLLIASGTLLHALVESQARYHFVMQPWLLAAPARCAAPHRPGRLFRAPCRPRAPACRN